MELNVNEIKTTLGNIIDRVDDEVANKVQISTLSRYLVYTECLGKAMENIGIEDNSPCDLACYYIRKKFGLI